MCNGNNLYQCDGCGKLVIVSDDEIMEGMTRFRLGHESRIPRAERIQISYETDGFQADYTDASCNGSFYSLTRTALLSKYSKLEWHEFG